MTFPLTTSLLLDESQAARVDAVADLLTGGPNGRTAYMLSAARRQAQLVIDSRWHLHNQPAPFRGPLTDASYPANCGSRID